MSDCTWCGDMEKEGIWEVHRCIEDKEEGERNDLG
jgi:hypothetical protein